MSDTDGLFTSLNIESDEYNMRKRKIDEIEIDEMINMLNDFIKIYDLTDKQDPDLSNKTEKILLNSGLLASNIQNPNNDAAISAKNQMIDKENLKNLNNFLSQIQSFMYYPRFNDYIRNNKDKLLSILLSIQTDYYIPRFWLGYDRKELSPPARLLYKIQTLDNIFCKFGTMCYQRNPDHLKRFGHPNLSDELFVMGTTDREKPSNRRDKTVRKHSRRTKQQGGNKKNKTKKKRKKYTKKKRKYNKK